MWAEHGPRGTVADEPPRAALSNDQQQRRRRTDGVPPKAIQQGSGAFGCARRSALGAAPCQIEQCGRHVGERGDERQLGARRNAGAGHDERHADHVVVHLYAATTRHASRITMEHATCNAYATSGTWMYDVM